jgi:PAS domain S-box-containing protein
VVPAIVLTTALGVASSVWQLYRQALGDAAWIALAGLLVLLIAGAAARLLRQRAQLDLAARTEAQLKAFIQHAPLSIAMLDRDMNYLAASGRWLREYGRGLAELTGRNHYQVHPDVPEEWRRVHRQCLSGSTIRNDEDCWIQADGSRHWLAWVVSPWTDENGAIGGIIISADDITDRKQAEDMLRKLSRAVEQSPASVIITDLNARIEYVNDAFQQITGYGREEVIGRSPAMLGSGQTPRERYAELWSALRQGQTWKGQLSNRRKDGREYVDSAVISPIREADGRVTHYVAVQQDITERLHLNEELERHRHHLEELVQVRTAELRDAHEKLVDTQFAMDSVGIGIHWADAETGRFLYVNRYAAQMLGYTPEQMLRLRVPDVNPNLPEPRFRAVVEQIRERGFARFESTERAHDGREIPVEVNVYWLPGKQAAGARLIAFITDISARKEVERMLVQAKEAAEAANVAKSSFLANMSHEIRTPMNAILGLTHLLGRSSPTPEQAERLEKITQAARHLLSIINDILDLSKIEAGKLVLERSDFALGTVLDQVRSLVAEEANLKGLRLEVQCEAAALWVHGDPMRLRQALLNYAGNAIKFTDHGHVRLRAQLLEDRDHGVLVRFEVQDTGVGVPRDKLQGLFQPFEQADISTTRRFGGTGLGLTITRRLTGLMGGECGAASEPGVGSTFWFAAGAFPRPRAGVARGRRSRARGRGGAAPASFGQARAAGRGRPGQPDGRDGPAGGHRLEYRRGRRRPRRRRQGDRDAVRPDPDGCADVADGRPGGDARDPGPAAAGAHADPGDDRQRIRGGPAALYRRRDERLHRQAGRSRYDVRQDPPVAVGERRRGRPAASGRRPGSGFRAAHPAGTRIAAGDRRFQGRRPVPGKGGVAACVPSGGSHGAAPAPDGRVRFSGGAADRAPGARGIRSGRAVDGPGSSRPRRCRTGRGRRGRGPGGRAGGG